MPTSSGFQTSEILTAQNTNTYLLRPYGNCIINGAMNISQRGTTVAGITTFAYYTADRWFHSISGAGTWTDTVQSLTASDAPVAEGIRNSWKTTCTTANGSLAAGAFKGLVQAMEGANVQQFAKGTASAKPFALSFWVRSNLTGTYIAELIDQDNNRSVSASYTIASSNVWQKVRLIFPADVTGLFSNGISASCVLFMWLAVGSDRSGGALQTVWATQVQNKRATGQVNLAASVNNFFEITGVQLEPNSVCTPFEMEDLQVTYAKCWRYFQRHLQPSMRGVCAGGFSRMGMSYPVMRTSPSLTSNGGTMGYWTGYAAVQAAVVITAVYNNSNTTIEIDTNSSGFGTGWAAVFYQNAAHTFYVDLSAEL